jgi:Tol biopolymer transport system component
LYFVAEGPISRVRPPSEDVETVVAHEPGTILTQVESLPGGRVLLYTVWAALGGEFGSPEIWSIDLESQDRQLVTPGANARYAASGHLLWGTADGHLMAAPFDLGSATISGSSSSVQDGLRTIRDPGWTVRYHLSDAGDLVYETGTGASSRPREFVWVTRTGAETPLESSETLDWSYTLGMRSIRLSPDGSRVVYTNSVGGRTDIFVRTLPDGPPVQLTFTEASDQAASWTPAGDAIVYSSLAELDASADLRGEWRLWRVPANGAGEPAVLYGGPDDNVGAAVWSPDGQWLVWRRNRTSLTASQDLMAFRPQVDSAPRPLIASEAGEKGAAISPDGLWIAYTSNEEGRDEVYVQPFPNVDDGKWKVSTGGGIQPVWARDGGELFYLSPTADLMAAEYTVTAGVFQPGRVTSLFTLPNQGGLNSNSDNYDVAPDGQRFLTTRPASGSESGATGPQIVLVKNFLELLRERLPN